MDYSSEEIESLYEAAMEHFENEEYEQALPLLVNCASKNHAESQLQLGIMYSVGYGVTVSLKDAAGQFRAAAEQGCTEAQGYLGRAYLYGEGVEQSNRKAVKWLTMAAESNDAGALNCLAYMYHEGMGCDVSMEKALELYLRAVDEGDPDAAYNAGSMYLKGEGCEASEEKATEMFRLAAENEDPQAMIELGLIVGGNEALELFRKAWDLGEPDGLYHYAIIHNDPRDMLWEAAEAGSTKALNALAGMVESGEFPRLDAIYQVLLRKCPEEQESYEEFLRIIGRE
ncbi:MAG: sel1 repeat family protein [archaeon]|nr:sel1 repeat family protein [archaeon]